MNQLAEMNHYARDEDAQDIFAFQVSDEALEAAAHMGAGPAFSFPNAPTVSVLVVCCSNDVTTSSELG